MKTLLLATLITLTSTIAIAQQAQQCQIMSDGRIFCTPAGGQPSIYRP